MISIQVLKAIFKHTIMWFCPWKCKKSIQDVFQMHDVFVVSYSHLYLCVVCIQVQNSTCIQYILKLNDIQNKPAGMQEYFMMSRNKAWVNVSPFELWPAMWQRLSHHVFPALTRPFQCLTSVVFYYISSAYLADIPQVIQRYNEKCHTWLETAPVQHLQPFSAYSSSMFIFQLELL